MPDRNDETPVEPDNGVLTSTGSVDTTGIGIVDGATAQVDIVLPPLVDDEDDFVEDDAPAEPAPAAATAPDPSEAAAPATGSVTTGAVPTATASVATPPAEPVDAGQTGELEPLVDPPAPVQDADVVDADVVPPTRRAAHHAAEPDKHALERSRHAHTPELDLQARRLGEIAGGRETADLLTADRLLDPAHVVRPEPEGGWQRFVYTVSGRRVNLGDGRRARDRKELDARISLPLEGGAKFVPVMSRKGGVGKTTITTLLGMALADARNDRVIAVDANPDRGTLADRISRASGKTIRDLARMRGEVVGFNQLSSIVARDETRLDVLASDPDPHISEAFSDRDYHDVASLAAHYYSIVLTDTGTGIVHSVMDATLDLADDVVIVAGLSVEEARLASETLTWLETNGFAELVRRAVVVLNNSRPGAPVVKPAELQAHFGSRVRAVVAMPYDPHIAAGSAVHFRDLAPKTRLAARELAALVVGGLRTPAA